MKTEQIFNFLERIANLLRTDTRKAGVCKGLQPVQMEALHYLSCCNRYSNTPAAVSDYLGLTKGTVSQTLGVLENAGFIEKLPDLKDRRIVHLQLTEMGQVLVNESIPPKLLEAAMELTTETEQEFILSALSQILQAMQQANKLKSFGVCKTCRYHQLEVENLRRCALTGETLTNKDSEKICREHVLLGSGDAKPLRVA